MLTSHKIDATCLSVSKCNLVVMVCGPKVMKLSATNHFYCWCGDNSLIPLIIMQVSKHIVHKYKGLLNTEILSQPFFINNVILIVLLLFTM